MKLTEFMEVTGVSIIRNDTYSEKNGYVRYQCYKINTLQGKWRNSSGLTVNKCITDEFCDALYKQIDDTATMLGFKGTPPRRGNANLLGWQLGIHRDELNSFIRENYRDTPFGRLSEVVLNREEIEDDISTDMAFSARAIAWRWIEKHDDEWINNVLGLLKIADKTDLSSKLSYAINKKHHSLMTIEDILMAEKELGHNRMEEHAALRLKKLFKETGATNYTSPYSKLRTKTNRRKAA